MIVVERKPVPLYEVTCPEYHSKIRYKASEVSFSHICCPVCGISLWANTIKPAGFEEGEA